MKSHLPSLRITVIEKTMNKHKIFIGSIAFLLLALGGFVFVQERIVLMGTEVILETSPIDPRDLFRGEYVILRYEIERSNLFGSVSLRNDKIVYARLEVDDKNIASVAEVSTQKPDFATALWLRGEATNRGVRFPDLEQYFVPEGAGIPIERLGSDVFARVRILDGDARVVGLLDKDLNEIDPYDYRP